MINKELNYPYKELLNSVTDYIYTVFIESGKVVNTIHGAACKKITGYAHTELEAEEELWLGMVHEDDREEVVAQAEKAKKGDTVPVVEHRIVHKNGEIRWVRNTIVVRFNIRNEVIGYDGLITDISIQKKAEVALKESEERYRHLLSSVTDYIFSVDVYKGKAIRTQHGPACVTVTGYTSEEYDADPELWYRMVVPDDRLLVVRNANKALKGEQVTPFEHRIIHKDGTVRWVRNTLVSRKDSEGYVHAYDGLISDITDRKRAQELAEEQKRKLAQAEKMATLGILVSGVAHEINNPNNFIKLNARLLHKIWKDVEVTLDELCENNSSMMLGGLKYPDKKEKIERLILGVHEGAHRIEKIVKGLKDFSRQDKGEIQTGVSINEVIQEAIVITQPLIHKSTKQFSLNLDENLPEIEGNFQKLEQVIINLITNSCQALTQPSQKLNIRTFLSSPKEVGVHVVDEGVGIADQDLKHIFDPFYTTRRESGGTGLGLSISYNIVKDHNGSLFFERNNGKTIATIKLPITQNKVYEPS